MTGKSYRVPVYSIESLKRCIRDRLNIDKQVSEDWPTWSYAGLEGHRVEYRKRNDLRLAQIIRELFKKGITQDQIDDTIKQTEYAILNKESI